MRRSNLASGVAGLALPCLCLLPTVGVAGDPAAGERPGGAAADVPWSFAPLRKAERLPEVEDADWPQARIDWFLLAKMEEAGVPWSPGRPLPTVQ